MINVATACSLLPQDWQCVQDGGCRLWPDLALLPSASQCRRPGAPMQRTLALASDLRLRAHPHPTPGSPLTLERRGAGGTVGKGSTSGPLLGRVPPSPTVRVGRGAGDGTDLGGRMPRATFAGLHAGV